MDTVVFSCGYLRESSARSLIVSLEEIGRYAPWNDGKSRGVLFGSSQKPLLYDIGDRADDPLIFEENNHI